jgi:hypothetical protein
MVLVPAVLYQSAALVQTHALMQLSTVVYQTMLQMKIIWVMFFSYCIMNHKFQFRQIVHNLQVFLCAILFVQKISPHNRRTIQNDIVFHSSLVFLGTGFSSAASVICEKLIKEDSDNIYIRNAQLAVGCILVQGVYCLARDIPIDFTNGSLLLYAANCYDALYGFCVSLFIYRFNSVMRTMSLVLSTCLTFGVNCFMGVVTPGPFEILSMLSCTFAIFLATM